MNIFNTQTRDGIIKLFIARHPEFLSYECKNLMQFITLTGLMEAAAADGGSIKPSYDVSSGIEYSDTWLVDYRESRIYFGNEPLASATLMSYNG